MAENRLTRLAPPGADAARTRLARLDGSRDLVIALAEGRVPPLVIHAVENRLTADDEVELGLRGNSANNSSRILRWASSRNSTVLPR